MRGQERGVIFDIGHGYGSFDFTVAEKAFSEGIMPDTISTDAHSLSAGSVMQDLPLTMSKLLGVGMSVEHVLAGVTRRPAEVIGRADVIGSIEVGRVADLTVLDLKEGEFPVADAYGNQRTIDRRFRVSDTIRAGIPWDGPLPHPARSLTRPAI